MAIKKVLVENLRVIREVQSLFRPVTSTKNKTRKSLFSNESILHYAP